MEDVVRMEEKDLANAEQPKANWEQVKTKHKEVLADKMNMPLISLEKLPYFD